MSPHETSWAAAEAQAREVAASCAPIFGFAPQVRLAPLGEDVTFPEGASEIFILPTALDLNLLQREALGRTIGEWRRRYPGVAIHHDDVDPGHPLVTECLADCVARAVESPQRAGLLLAASGHGDAATRAHSYRLMRLIWERLGMASGAVGFVRHATPFLLTALQECRQRQLTWVVLPQTQWPTEHVEYAAVILQNFQRDHPDARDWRMVDPPGAHPGMTAWLSQRVARLWNEKRSRDAVRLKSPKRSVPAKIESWTVGRGVIASAPAMAEVLERILPSAKPERIIVKVTWHGYATGTYTDPAALGLLLSALPAKAIIVEGHTSSRNLGGHDFDWETQAKENRAWIRQQDAEYLRRTGLAEVMARHGAQYVNVTEAFWDEASEECAPGLFVPKSLLEQRGCPMISFAKFKGPTRLAISNLFGLLPEPLRSTWHGPNITYFARVCCDIAKLYGSLFDLSAIDEALYSAVRWNRQGLYRSRWGNYDLIHDTGYVTASRSLPAADILASRLQGQDVNRSAFFDVVRAELGWDDAAANEPLPHAVQAQFS